MKKRLLFISLLILLFFSSCGIPNMVVPDSNAVSISADDTSKSYTITISDPFLLNRNNLSSYSPEIYLFYTVSTSSTSSGGFSKLITTFNTNYCSYPDCKPLSSSDGEVGFLDESYNDDTYSLFLFNGNSGIISNSYLEGDRFNLEFSQVNGDLILSIYGSDNSLIIKRTLKSNGDNSFFTNEFQNEIGSYVDSIEIYAVISYSFSEYSNVWNTKLSISKNISIDF